jgi:hypothetical protein
MRGARAIVRREILVRSCRHVLLVAAVVLTVFVVPGSAVSQGKAGVFLHVDCGRDEACADRIHRKIAAIIKDTGKFETIRNAEAAKVHIRVAVVPVRNTVGDQALVGYAVAYLVQRDGIIPKFQNFFITASEFDGTLTNKIREYLGG